MEHDVLTEHRRLGELFEEVVDSLRPDGSPEATREALEELRAALETHFDQEDRLYYPAIWALRPDLEAHLRDLVGSHGDFLARVDCVQGLLGRGERAAARDAFQNLRTAFRRHETAEEDALAALEREIDAAR